MKIQDDIILSAKSIFNVNPSNVDKVAQYIDECGIENETLWSIMNFLIKGNKYREIPSYRIDLAKKVFNNDKVDYVVDMLTKENFDQDFSIIKSKGWEWETEMNPIVYFFVDRAGNVID